MATTTISSFNMDISRKTRGNGLTVAERYMQGTYPDIATIVANTTPLADAIGWSIAFDVEGEQLAPAVTTFTNREEVTEYELVEEEETGELEERLEVGQVGNAIGGIYGGHAASAQGRMGSLGYGHTGTGLDGASRRYRVIYQGGNLQGGTVRPRRRTRWIPRIRSYLRHTFRCNTSLLELLDSARISDGDYDCCTVVTLCIRCLDGPHSVDLPEVLQLACRQHKETGFGFTCHVNCKKGQLKQEINGLCDNCRQRRGVQKAQKTEIEAKGPMGIGGKVAHSSDNRLNLEPS